MYKKYNLMVTHNAQFSQRINCYNSSNLQVLVHDVLILLIDEYQIINEPKEATRNQGIVSRTRTSSIC